MQIVGRQAELEHIEILLEKTLAGESQMCFITGEAGSGKSKLITAFLDRV